LCLSLLIQVQSGSVITATVPGATITSTGLDIKYYGGSICQTVKVVSYGVVECLTIAGEIAADTELFIYQDGSYYACESTDTTVCNYEQLADAGFPAVTMTTTGSSSSIVFTGTDFDFSADYSAIATFAGI